MNRLPRYLTNLLAVPLFWALSACTSLGPVVPRSSQPAPPQKTTVRSASQAIPATQAASRNGSKRSGEASAAGSLGSSRVGYLHTVRWQGETLSLIAQWYTGSWKHWKTLAGSNSGINPDRLEIGDRVVIPQGLLKNRKPLPRDLVLSLAVRERGQQPPPDPEKTEPLDLFGPKD